MKIEVIDSSAITLTLSHKEAIDVEALLIEFCATSINPFRGKLSCDIASAIRDAMLGGV